MKLPSLKFACWQWGRKEQQQQKGARISLFTVFYTDLQEYAYDTICTKV